MRHDEHRKRSTSLERVSGESREGLLEGVVSNGIRRPAIHGRKNNDDVESNPGTAKYDSSIKASRKE